MIGAAKLGAKIMKVNDCSHTGSCFCDFGAKNAN